MSFQPLSEAEARVLGCLLEKEMSTPEYYPMTLNALTNACNQKTNRDPVVSYGEDEVSQALENLRGRGLALKVSGGGGRVPKFRHTLAEAQRLALPEAAVLCVLLVRGPQTLGELRARTGRMRAFESLEQVEATLQGLSVQRSETLPPLVMRLPRQAGRKEYRYAHLMCGEPTETLQDDSGADTAPAPADAAGTRLSGVANHGDRMLADMEEKTRALEDKVDALDDRVGALEAELAALRRQFGEFKAQFE